MPLSVFVTEVERILRGIPPLDPRARTLQTASGTRDVADAELGYETAARLNAIVVYPMLVEQLEGAALGLANSIKVDTSNPMHRDEGDSSSWFRKVYSRPALSIASTCMAGGVKFPRDMSRSNFPFIATSHGGKKKPIPDDLLYRSFVAPQSLAEAPTSEVILCMEYKTKMALTRDTLAKLLQERRLTSDGELLAIPYGWPRNDVVISKETKIITQVYCQMWKMDVSYAILSCYDVTVFFYLDRTEKILYLSQAYFRETDPTLLAVFSWFCLALGMLPEAALKIPKFDMTAVVAFGSPENKEHWVAGPATEFTDKLIGEFLKSNADVPERKKRLARSTTRSRDKGSDRNASRDRTLPEGPQGRAIDTGVGIKNRSVGQNMRQDTQDRGRATEPGNSGRPKTRSVTSRMRVPSENVTTPATPKKTESQDLATPKARVDRKARKAADRDEQETPKANPRTGHIRGRDRAGSNAPARSS